MEGNKKDKSIVGKVKKFAPRVYDLINKRLKKQQACTLEDAERAHEMIKVRISEAGEDNALYKVFHDDFDKIKVKFTGSETKNGKKYESINEATLFDTTGSRNASVKDALNKNGARFLKFENGVRGIFKPLVFVEEKFKDIGTTNLHRMYINETIGGRPQIYSVSESNGKIVQELLFEYREQGNELVTKYQIPCKVVAEETLEDLDK